MNRAALSLLLACALTPGALAETDPFVDLLRVHAARDVSGPLPLSPARGLASWVQVRTMPNPTHGIRLRNSGHLTRAALHVSREAQISQLGQDDTARILNAATQLASHGCETPDLAPDLELKTTLNGERVVMNLNAAQTCPHLARFARVTLEVLGYEAPVAAAPTAVIEPAPEAAQTASDDGLTPTQTPTVATSPEPQPEPVAATDPAGLLTQLMDLDPQVRAVAAAALDDAVRAHPQAAPQLLNKALSSTDPVVRRAGIRALDGFTGDPDALASVIRWAAGSSDPQVRAAAERAAARMRLPRVTPPTPDVASTDPAEEPAAPEPDASEEGAATAAPEEGAGVADVVADAQPTKTPEEASDDGGLTLDPEPTEEPAAEPTATPAAEPISVSASDCQVLTADDAVIDVSPAADPASLVPAPGQSTTPPPAGEQPEQPAEQPADGWPRQGVIVIQSDRPAAQRQRLRVRAAPVNGAILGSLTHGTRVTVLGPVERGYYPIDYQGRRGWVSAQPRHTQLAPDQQPATPSDPPADPAPAWPKAGTVVIHADRAPSQRLSLRVRATPVDGAVVGGLRYGQAITVVGPPERGFYPIEFNGGRAWVSANPRHTRVAP